MWIPAAKSRAFAGHTDWVSAVAFSPDGRAAFSASVNKTIKRWDVTADTEVPVFAGHGDAVRHVVFSPDDRTALAAGDDKTLRLVDVATMMELRCFSGHTKEVIGVAFAPDGRTAISGGEDSTLRLWDLATGVEQQPTFRGHAGCVWTVAYLPDGRSLLSGETTRFCDSGMRKPTRRSALSHLRMKGLSTASLVTPDGRNAVSASKDMTLRLWDLETGQLTRVLKGHNSWVISVAISRDGVMRCPEARIRPSNSGI